MTLIKFKTAKLAKEKRFNEHTSYLYFDGKKKNTSTKTCNTNFHSSRYHSAPTQSELQKWLRRKHNIDVIPNRQNNNGQYFTYIWNKNEEPYVLDNSMNSTSYEEALERGLLEALKLIEDGKN